MSEWITVKDKKEKEVENKWIQLKKKDKEPEEPKTEWIKKKVKEEKQKWITKKSDKKEIPYITKKSDKEKVEEKASGGLIKGFPRLATKGFKRQWLSVKKKKVL